MTHNQHMKIKAGMKKTFALTTLCTGILMGVSGTAHAANWLMLQGTEPADHAPRAKVWGFIQPEYQKDFSSPNAKGGYIPPKLIGPSLDTQSSFNIRRARIGVRGIGLPLDSHINYFILTEFGNNGITNGGRYGSYRPYLTDASITLNYIKGARVRLGLFKTPGPLEGLQGIAAFPYINFTNVTNQLMLERYPTAGENNIPPQSTPNANMNGYSKPVGAFRDTGVQVFDAFDVGKWEHTYAVMVGNGNGVQMADNDSNKDVYLYWSSAYIFDKKSHGPFRQDLNMFAWYQGGKRTDAYNTSQEQSRKRYGLGFSLHKHPYRLTAEYMWGKGMIFQGPNAPQGIFNDFKARGGYIEGGWFIPNSRFELDLRYDTYKRNLNQPNTATFNTITAGVQYHFTKKTRVALDYAHNSFSSDAPKQDAQLKDVKGRVSLQVTAIF